MKNVKILEDISKEEDTSSSSIDDKISLIIDHFLLFRKRRIYIIWNTTRTTKAIKEVVDVT